MRSVKENKFDRRYDIRIANVNDIDAIMHFIDEYWAKGHIMGVNRSLFEYEFRDGDRVNFILAVDKRTGEIECIQGFLPCSKTEDPQKRDYWGSIWKLNDTHKNMPFLGLEVDDRMNALLDARMGMGNGLNPKTSLLISDQIFKSKTGKMKQYYLLGKVEEYKIAVINRQPEIKRRHNVDEAELIPFHDIDEMRNQFDIEKIDALPYKDNWYFNKRYFKHPVYRYLVYGVRVHDEIRAVTVFRGVRHEDSKVLRVIDYIGDHAAIPSLGRFFEETATNGGYEYIDFYEYGVEDQYLLDAGLVLRDEDDPNIIPNYFEPFVQENIDIWVGYALEGTTFFKGDGDQDRPNKIEN